GPKPTDRKVPAPPPLAPTQPPGPLPPLPRPDRIPRAAPPPTPPPSPRPREADVLTPPDEPLLSIPPGPIWVPPVRPAPPAATSARPAESGEHPRAWVLLGHLIPLGILILLVL